VPLVKFSTSPVGKSVATQLQPFIAANATAMKSGATETEGVQAIAEAIAYGVAKAFADPSMATAFATGGAVPPGGNLLQGKVLHDAIKAVTTELG